jgi:hypothetical protein
VGPMVAIKRGLHTRNHTLEEPHTRELVDGDSYLLRGIYMAHEFRCPNAPLRATCASRVILCRVARVESFAPM